MVIHDSTLDRTTDAVKRWGGKQLRVSSYSMDELRKLDAGSWFAPSFARQKLSELGEALDTIQAGSITLIERKAGDAKSCAELIREKKLINQVVVQAFDWNYLRDYKKLEPTQVLAALGPSGSKDGRKLTDEEKQLGKEWVDEIHDIGVQVVAWNRSVDRDAVRYAHERGLKVWVYTIDEKSLAIELLRAGVDGIITNEPEKLRGIVAEYLADRKNQ